MNITFVGPSANLSGGMRVLAIYAHRLQARGHRVCIVTPPSPRPSLTRRVKDLVRGRGWPASSGPTHLDGLDVEHRILPAYRPVQDRDVPEADVVIATWWETAEWVARLAPSKGAKAYFIQHHEVFEYLPQARARATYRLPLHKIVVAEWLAELMRSEYGDRDVALVPNGVDTEQFFASPRGKGERPTIGMMYTRTPWKGCELSLRAYALAARAVPGLQLIAFGEQAPSGELPLPADAHFERTPSQERLRELYACCDAWLFGSRVEGFGLPVLEAMACRTPVIGTPAGAAPELIREGGGMLVGYDDAEGMARAIQEVCSMSDEAWRRLSDAAWESAQRRTWARATLEFERALERTVDLDQRGRARRSSSEGALLRLSASARTRAIRFVWGL